MVYIKCPGTGLVVPTGHIVADDQHLHMRHNRHQVIDCPFCTEQHVFTDDNGFFLSPADTQGSISELSGSV
jgi:hypothetical protein